MNVKKKVDGNQMELVLEGKIDTVSAPAFEEEIACQLEGISSLTVDLAGIEYISSAGLRALLFLQQTMDENQGTMTLTNIPELVMDIFQVTGFTEFIKVV